MNSAIVLANLCGWPIIQLGVAWSITRLSPHRFMRSRAIDRIAKNEVEFYRRWLRVRKWKSMLPDGARWVCGTFPRKKLEARDAEYLSRFVAETRRGELAHWIMVACCPLFFLWNPVWVWPIMIFYAVASNAPCIVAQRYNRAIASRLLRRHSAKTQRPSTSDSNDNRSIRASGTNRARQFKTGTRKADRPPDLIAK
jgi:glycosyl-4,4'-diaponeurosporenoate acyltransferase